MVGNKQGAGGNAMTTRYSDSRYSESRYNDGSAGDTDYGVIGQNYSHYRKPDPNIAAFIHTAFPDAKSVLNVGAGAGSYEPTDKDVTAIEPSASMRAQRPPHLPRAIDATAEKLPFADNSFDAAMTTFSVHQWSDLDAGLHEMRRVTRGVVAVLTCDPDALDRFWLNDYVPEVIQTEARRYPAVHKIAGTIGKTAQILPVPIPLLCLDGFNEAYYGRPEKLLDPKARQACSAWSFIEHTAVTRFEDHLQRDLDQGTWDKKFGALRTQSQFFGSLVLIIGHP